MKRTIVFLLAALLALNLAACGKSAKPAQTDENTQSPAPDQSAQSPAPAADAAPAQDGAGAEADGTVTDQDPSVDVTSYDSLEALNAAAGAKLIRPASVTAQEEVFQIQAEDGAEVAQYVFLVDGIPCGVRFCSDPSIDISGMLTGDGSPAFSGAKGDVTSIDGVSLGRWTTADGQYVLVVGPNDAELFERLFEEMKQQITD